jgi:hypothetical protein
MGPTNPIRKACRKSLQRHMARREGLAWTSIQMNQSEIALDHYMHISTYLKCHFALLQWCCSSSGDATLLLDASIQGLPLALSHLAFLSQTPLFVYKSHQLRVSNKVIGYSIISLNVF